MLKALDIAPGYKTWTGVIGLVLVYFFGAQVTPETKSMLEVVFGLLATFGLGAKVGRAPAPKLPTNIVPLVLVALSFALTACGTCDFEKVAAEQNVRNVESLAADTARWAPTAERQSVLDRNTEAITLAKRLVPVEK